MDNDSIIYPITVIDSVYDNKGKQLADILGEYQPKGSYSLSSHNHDSVYSKLNHTHNYAATSHTHDDRYYTESEINTKLNSKANSSHTHPYLPLTGDADMTGMYCVLGKNNTHTKVNVASDSYNENQITGSIVIVLPNGFQNVMQKHWISIYNYSNDTSIDLLVSFYDFMENNQFYSATAVSTNIKVTEVRLGYRNSDKHVCIFIGYTNTVWHYPKVFINMTMCGHSQYLYKTKPDILIGVTNESQYTIYPAVKCNIGAPFMRAVLDSSGYYTIGNPHNEAAYIKTPEYGMLPYANRKGTLGATTWNFEGIYAANYYSGNQKGNISAIQSGTPSATNVLWAW